MTATYDDYRRALADLKELPALTAGDLKRAADAHSRARELAEKSETASQRMTADSLRAIEAQLAAARAALDSLGTSNLVPPQMRPSGGVHTATRDDIAEAQETLAASVHQLRQAVESEIRRGEAENARLVREAAERERLAREVAQRASAAEARRRMLIRLGVMACVALVVLVVILKVII